jgi:hypothetical protein
MPTQCQVQWRWSALATPIRSLKPRSPRRRTWPATAAARSLDRQRPGHCDGFGRQLEEDLGGKGVVVRMQAGKALHDRVRSGAFGHTEQPKTSGACVSSSVGRVPEAIAKTLGRSANVRMTHAGERGHRSAVSVLQVDQPIAVRISEEEHWRPSVQVDHFLVVHLHLRIPKSAVGGVSIASTHAHCHRDLTIGWQ